MVDIMLQVQAKDVSQCVKSLFKVRRWVGASRQSRDLVIARLPITSPKLHFKEAEPCLQQRTEYSLQRKMSQPATPDITAPDQAPSSTSAAAHAYQHSLQPQSTTPTSAASPAADTVKDTLMSDRTPDRPAVSQYPLDPIKPPSNITPVSYNGS
jgi:hypothetical protein